MPKSQNQKLKLLYLKDYLTQQTDADHPVTLNDIIEEYARHDIAAERKSVYDDIHLLEMYGMDIYKPRGKYRILSREFELEEVRLLVDMVQSSNFITNQKTAKLVGKLKGLVSVHESKQLSRQVYVRNRVKNMNESVYINVDRISDAISSDRDISFKYYGYTMQKKKEYRHGGKTYHVSPFALIWVDQNYYMLCYNPDHPGQLTHFRVDRMNSIQLAKGPRTGKDLFSATDMSTYTTKVFHMYSGEVQRVMLRFHRSLVDSVIDRFGEDIILIPEDEEHFSVSLEIVVSPQFFGWLFAFGSHAEILSPSQVREDYMNHISSVQELYETT